jgi:putative ABC transport system permease protein
VRLLRLLLRLYPRAHRDAYEAEMLAVMRARRERSGGTGARATAGAAWDLAAGAAGVHADRIRRTTMGAGRGWGLDLRFVARSLRGSVGYVATAVVVLACAVAANASVLAYVRGTLLDEPPYPDPASIVVVWGSNVVDGQYRDVISGPNYVDVQERITTLQRVAAFHTGADYLRTGDRPEVLDVQEVTYGFFEVLGVQPALGRLFDEDDRYSGRAQSAVVTYAFWRDRLGSDPGAIGTLLPFVDNPSTIIGVLPEGFEFVSPTPVFITLQDDVLASMERTNIHFNALGRLAPGATVADVNRELRSISEEIRAEHAWWEGWSFLAEPMHDVAVEGVRPAILVLAGTVALVLLVALVNLATLFRIRALARGQELRVRAALGAGRLRLLRVLTLETVLVAGAGALLGLAATPLLLARLAETMPLWIAIPDSAARLPVLRAVLDPLVLGVSLSGAVVGSLLLTAPGFRGSLRDAAPLGTRRGVHPGLRGARVLVGVELALATVLCLGATLTIQSTARLLSTDVGVEPAGLLTLYFADVWGDTPTEQVAYFRDVVQEVERISGVRRAGVIDYVDFQGEDDYQGLTFLDRPETRPDRHQREEWRRVDEGLFEAAGMRIVAGRGFASSDFEGEVARAVIVNQAFAEKHWPGGDPIGTQISVHEDGYREMQIVGVVADVRALGPSAPARPVLYVPNQGTPRGTQGLYVRVTGDPMSYAEAVREAIWAVDPSQPITDIAPMTERVERWVAIPRTTRALVGTLATLSWLLSAVGVFGVVAYAVRTRRSEMGVRLALGASSRRLEADQLRAVAPVVIVGVGVGVVLGIGAARAAGALLHGVSPLAPVPLFATVAAMGLAALVATWLPARRVGRVDPREVIAAE